MAGIYAILCLALNVQWGMGGLFNAGIAGFFAVGAYTSAILTTPYTEDLGLSMGGFNLPFPVGIAAAAVLSGLAGWAVAKVCVRLKSDYLAMASIGIAEIMRLIIVNEEWVTNGSLGIQAITRPFEDVIEGRAIDVIYLAIVWGIVLAVFVDLPAAAPLAVGADAAGDPRQRGIGPRRRQECRALPGRDIRNRRRDHGHRRRVDGTLFQVPVAERHRADCRHLPGVGDADGRRQRQQSRRHRRRVADLGDLVGFRNRHQPLLPPELATRSSYIRMLLIGLILQIVLQKFRAGLVPERSPKLDYARPGDHHKLPPGVT